MRSVFVVVVGGDQQLRVLRGRTTEIRISLVTDCGKQAMAQVFHLRGPVQTGDDAVFGPVFVVEESAEGQAGAAALVSEGGWERSHCHSLLQTEKRTVKAFLV